MKQQEKFCPMSFNKGFSTMYCQQSCAWYTGDGCTITVLAQYKKQRLQEANCNDVFELPIQPKGAN